MADVFGDASPVEVTTAPVAAGYSNKLAGGSTSVSPAANGDGLVGDFGTAAVVVSPVAGASAQAGPVFEIGVVVRTTMTIFFDIKPPIVLPAYPVIPDDPVFEEGNWSYPSPTYGGVVVRALYGKVVDMATPTITDGKPS
jgi:hypothetical protein